MLIRNVSGEDREVPALGRLVEADTVVEVPDDLAASFLIQPRLWEPAEPVPEEIEAVLPVEDDGEQE